MQLADGVLLAPLVGRIDSQRAEEILSRLLVAAANGRARLIILEIAGVPTVDAQVATALLRTAQALRLLGCRVAFTGITPEVAMILADLDLYLDEVITARSPQEILASRPPGS